MRSAVIRERPGGVERMHESSSLVENSRVPQPARHPREPEVLLCPLELHVQTTVSPV